MSSSVLTTTATTERTHVSKSKFLQGSQCKKLLWFACNAKNQSRKSEVMSLLTQANHLAQLVQQSDFAFLDVPLLPYRSPAFLKLGR